MIDSVDDVIEALGGPAKVAALCGVGASAVSNWRSRDRISQGSFMIVTAALADLGETVSPSVFGFKGAATTDEARA